MNYMTGKIKLKAAACVYKTQLKITGISSNHNSSIIDNFHITGIKNQVMQMITVFAFQH